MADNEETPSTPETAEEITPSTFGSFRKSTKLYSADNIDAIVARQTNESKAREKIIEDKITEHRSEVTEQIQTVNNSVDEKVTEAKTQLTNLIDEKIEGGGMHYMGILDTLDELNAIPAESRKHGRFWVVNEDGCTYIWTVPEPTEEVPEPTGFWKKLASGGTIDLSNYYTKDQVYNKDEVDVFKNRATNNETKLASIVNACKTLDGYGLLEDEEYTTDQIQLLTNKLVTVVQTIASIALT